MPHWVYVDYIAHKKYHTMILIYHNIKPIIVHKLHTKVNITIRLQVFYDNILRKYHVKPNYIYSYFFFSPASIMMKGFYMQVHSDPLFERIPFQPVHPLSLIFFTDSWRYFLSLLRRWRKNFKENPDKKIPFLSSIKGEISLHEWSFVSFDRCYLK